MGDAPTGEDKAGLAIPEDLYNVLMGVEASERTDLAHSRAVRSQDHYADLQKIGLAVLGNLVATNSIINQAAASAFSAGVGGFNQIDLGKAEGTISPNIPGSGNMAPVVPNVNPTGNQQPGLSPSMGDFAAALSAAIKQGVSDGLAAAGIKPAAA